MRLGILGGGQLARMLALAAHPLGVRCVFVDPSPRAPAAPVADAIVAPYDDVAALTRMAEQVDVATYEFENVPETAARLFENALPLRPRAEALRVAQDRLEEKTTLESLGIPVVPYRAVNSRAELADAVAALGTPCVLKTRRFGYDGKGQVVLRSDDGDALDGAWAKVGAGVVPCVLERFLPFDREASQVAVRGVDGDVRLYPLVETRHRGGILAEAHAPAPETSPAMQTLARDYVSRLLGHLDYVGVMALELFCVGEHLYANELAPRVHNSGHWTQDGACTSQFENHVRAVLGLPLGPTESLGRSVMFNLVGGVPPVAEVLSVRDARLHLYGKSAAPGRKLGHVTLVRRDGESDDDFDARVEKLRDLVGRCARFSS
jgi:5-(carboxyamino)imidazole ribonucleotide synthase